jgi:hypothetical protein
MGPPYPVSASAITGTEGEREAIVEALESMSFRVAMPRSAVPRRDMFVPAPVCDGRGVSDEDKDKGRRKGMRRGGRRIYHVEAFCSCCESDPGREAIVDAWGDDDVVFLAHQLSQLLCSCHGHFCGVFIVYVDCLVFLGEFQILGKDVFDIVDTREASLP